MIDNKPLGISNKFQGLPGSAYPIKISVIRPAVVTPSNPNSGYLGEPSDPDVKVPDNYVVVGHPAAIVSLSGELLMQSAGLTEKAKYRLLCPFRMLTDGTLVVKERDIVINLQDGVRYLVINSHDPMNTRVEIVATIEFGTAG